MYMSLLVPFGSWQPNTPVSISALVSWLYHLQNTKGASWPTASLFVVENMEHPQPPTIE